MGEKEIDKSDWKTENPKMFEFDSKNNIVDIFVRQDPDCPFPFHKEDWWHQGFYLEEFILYMNLFFERNNLNYKVMETEEIEELLSLSQPRPLTQKDIDKRLRQYED